MLSSKRSSLAGLALGLACGFASVIHARADTSQTGTDERAQASTPESPADAAPQPTSPEVQLQTDEMPNARPAPDIRPIDAPPAHIPPRTTRLRIEARAAHRFERFASRIDQGGFQNLTRFELGADTPNILFGVATNVIPFRRTGSASSILKIDTVAARLEPRFQTPLDDETSLAVSVPISVAYPPSWNPAHNEVQNVGRVGGGAGLGVHAPFMQVDLQAQGVFPLEGRRASTFDDVTVEFLAATLWNLEGRIAVTAFAPLRAEVGAGFWSFTPARIKTPMLTEEIKERQLSYLTFRVGAEFFNARLAPFAFIDSPTRAVDATRLHLVSGTRTLDHAFGQIGLGITARF